MDSASPGFSLQPTLQFPLSWAPSGTPLWETLIWITVHEIGCSMDCERGQGILLVPLISFSGPLGLTNTHYMVSPCVTTLGMAFSECYSQKVPNEV